MNYIDIKKNNLLKVIEKNNYQLVDNDLIKTLTSNNCKKCLQCSCCCNRYPCVFAPSDFLDITDIEYMKRIIDTELVLVSVSKEGFLTVRPVGKNELYNKKYSNNTCVLYNYKKGCLLDTFIRPSQGLLYIAKESLFSKCTALYTREYIYNDYKQYQEYLKKLYQYQKSIKRDYDLFNIPDNKIKKLTKCIITR